MTLCIRMLLAAVLLAFAQASTSYRAEIVRVAVQKTGTFAWELAAIRAHGLDKQANLSVQAVELASPEAGKIALRAGNADIIVSDWLWVSRERTLGAYIWAGLTEAAAITAIAVNKLPTAVVTLREGTRALDAALDEMATVFAIPRWRAFRHVILPQLAPYIAAAARSGLSLVWKIVLVAELLGRPNGVGFEIGVAFQLFDIPLLLAYSLSFTAIVLVIESLLVQPFEARASRWRPRAA